MLLRKKFNHQNFLRIAKTIILGISAVFFIELFLEFFFNQRNFLKEISNTITFRIGQISSITKSS